MEITKGEGHNIVDKERQERERKSKEEEKKELERKEKFK